MGYATEHETRPVRPSIIGSSSAKWWASLRCISPFSVADFLLSDDGHVVSPLGQNTHIYHVNLIVAIITPNF